MKELNISNKDINNLSQNNQIINKAPGQQSSSSSDNDNDDEENSINDTIVAPGQLSSDDDNDDTDNETEQRDESETEQSKTDSTDNTDYSEEAKEGEEEEDDDDDTEVTDNHESEHLKITHHHTSSDDETNEQEQLKEANNLKVNTVHENDNNIAEFNITNDMNKDFEASRDIEIDSNTLHTQPNAETIKKVFKEKNNELLIKYKDDLLIAKYIIISKIIIRIYNDDSSNKYQNFKDNVGTISDELFNLFQICNTSDISQIDLLKSKIDPILNEKYILNRFEYILTQVEQEFHQEVY